MKRGRGRGQERGEEGGRESGMRSPLTVLVEIFSFLLPPDRIPPYSEEEGAFVRLDTADADVALLMHCALMFADMLLRSSSWRVKG